MSRIGLLALLALILVQIALPARADIDPEILEELRGWTLVAETRVDGDFEGADYGKLVKLRNGMIFEWTTYHYTYSYAPECWVFATKFRGIVMWKLVIKDHIYSATRLK